MKYFAIAAGLTLSTFAHAENLPVSLDNIAGKWSCESVATDKVGVGMTFSTAYKTTISTKGLEKSPTATMTFRMKDMADADVSTYLMKSNATSRYAIDNGQLSVQNISGNITHVKHVSGIQIMPVAELKKQTYQEIAKETRDKVKRAINTSVLTANQWNFSVAEDEMDFNFTCVK